MIPTRGAHTVNFAAALTENRVQAMGVQKGPSQASKPEWPVRIATTKVQKGANDRISTEPSPLGSREVQSKGSKPWWSTRGEDIGYHMG